MTDSETLSAINEGFAAEGYDTPQKVTDFVRASVRQVKLIICQAEFGILTAEQGAAQTTAQQEREAKLAEVSALEDNVKAFIRGLAANAQG